MKRSKVHNAASTKTRLAIKQLGENIRIARKKRRISMNQLAERISTSYQSVSRMEKGDPTVSLGIIAAALDVFGLTDQLKELASPSLDEIGKSMERERLPKRVKASNKDFDF